jgi:hypothetical protein
MIESHRCARSTGRVVKAVQVPAIACLLVIVFSVGVTSLPAHGAGAATPHRLPDAGRISSTSVRELQSPRGAIPHLTKRFPTWSGAHVSGVARRQPAPAHWVPAARPHMETTQGTLASTNWSGWIDQGTQFTAVSGDWTVPSVPASGSNTEVSSTWIGIDGVDNSSLIQTGTTQASVDGTTTYFAWYEILPAVSVPIGDVFPGDQMESSVVKDSPGQWTISIDDLTQDQGFSSEFSYSGPGTSAEWIEEDPTDATTSELFPLADFGTVQISDLGVSGSDLGLSDLSPVVMVDGGGTIVAHPGDIVDDGFTVTYGSPLFVTTTSLPSATAGVAYSTTLGASGGTAPYTWSVTGGTLPPDLSLDATTGVISGTPTTTGVNAMTVEVTDADATTATASLPLTVVAPGPYTAVTPTRICDTRAGNPSGLTGDAAQCNGTDNAGDPLAPDEPLTIDVAGSFGVPTDATAVVLNVTGINPTSGGYVTVYPAGNAAPTASNLNFKADQVVPNLVETGVGVSGQVSIISSTHINLAVDLEGYVTPTGQAGAGLYNPLATPARICDTRANNPSALSGTATQCNGTDNAGERLSPGTPLAVQVEGDGGVPASGVSAVVLNVTVVNPAGSGYLTAYPEDSPIPTASNLNYTKGEDVPNRVIVPVNPTTGQVSLVASQATDVAVDVSGWYSSAGGTGTQYTPEAAPVRICDTRANNPSSLTGAAAQCNGTVGAGDPIGPGKTLSLNVADLAAVPSGATAVVLNVTAIQPSARTYLTVFPTGTPPTVSDLNPVPGETEANLVVATVSANGTFFYNNAGTTNIVVDVAGWYS